MLTLPAMPVTLFAAPIIMHNDVDVDKFHTIEASQYTFTDP